MDLLVRLIGASELRAKVISANIANQNTPGYKRRVVEFEEHLKGALLEPGGRTSEVEPSVLIDEETEARRPDGNNVLLEEEMNGLRENRLLAETYLAILRGHFNLLQAAITEGR